MTEVHHAMTRYRRAGCITAALLLAGPAAQALPSLRCETVEVVDHDGIGQQMELPKLLLAMTTVPLRLVPNGTPADVKLDLSFFSASGRVDATIRSWAENDPVHLQSERVSWHEDFAARRRVVQPMRVEDAQAFRQQLLQAVTEFVAQRTAAVAIASDPPGLSVTIAIPSGAVAPINRNRTVAVLGCLREGTELEGYVSFADGQRAQFKQRANLTPGRFVVGERATSEQSKTTESPAATEELEAPTTATPQTPRHPSTSSSWPWWMVGLSVPLLAVLAFLLWRRRSPSSHK